MALQQPPGLLGISHQHGGHGSARDLQGARVARQPPPADLSADERNAWDQLDVLLQERAGLRASRWRNRPQTLYGIADSPVGLAAWMLDHDMRSYEMIARVFDGQAGRADAGRHPRQRHALLADEHRDLLGAPLLGHRTARRREASSTSRGVKIPVAVSAFPDEIYAAPKSWAEKAYPEAHPLQQARRRAATSRRGSSRSSSSRRCAPRSGRCVRRRSRRASRVEWRSARGDAMGPALLLCHAEARRTRRAAARVSAVASLTVPRHPHPPKSLQLPLQISAPSAPPRDNHRRSENSWKPHRRARKLAAHARQDDHRRPSLSGRC